MPSIKSRLALLEQAEIKSKQTGIICTTGGCWIVQYKTIIKEFPTLEDAEHFLQRKTDTVIIIDL